MDPGARASPLFWTKSSSRISDNFQSEMLSNLQGQEASIRAPARGVRLGRPRKLTPHQRDEALQRLAAGETYNVDPTTIGRLQ